MNLKLLVPPVLREYATAEVEVSGATAGEALRNLDAPLRMRVLNDAGELFPYLLLFLNDEEATLDSPLVDGDTIEIVAAAEGG